MTSAAGLLARLRKRSVCEQKAGERQSDEPVDVARTDARQARHGKAAGDGAHDVHAARGQVGERGKGDRQPDDDDGDRASRQESFAADEEEDCARTETAYARSSCRGKGGVGGDVVNDLTCLRPTALAGISCDDVRLRTGRPRHRRAVRDLARRSARPLPIRVGSRTRGCLGFVSQRDMSRSPSRRHPTRASHVSAAATGDDPAGGCIGRFQPPNHRADEHGSNPRNPG